MEANRKYQILTLHMVSQEEVKLSIWTVYNPFEFKNLDLEAYKEWVALGWWW